MEPGGRRRPGLYADILVPVLQVPKGGEAGPGGLLKILKNEGKEEDEEEEKEEDDDEEEMEGKRRDEVDMQDSLVVDEGIPLQLQLQISFHQEEFKQPHFSRKSSLSKHMFMFHGASCPSKILRDRYLAKLMARRRISLAICYITFKTRISFTEHMMRGAYLLEPGLAGVKDGFVRELMLLLDGISVGGQST